MPQIREQIAMVHLPPSKTLKYLFHVRKTRRRKLHIACGDFLQKSLAHSFRCVSFSKTGHVHFGCSLVNALTTPLAHYQPVLGPRVRLLHKKC